MDYRALSKCSSKAALNPCAQPDDSPVCQVGCGDQESQRCKDGEFPDAATHTFLGTLPRVECAGDGADCEDQCGRPDSARPQCQVPHSLNQIVDGKGEGANHGEEAQDGDQR